jgi:hypothetical protein
MEYKLSAGTELEFHLRRSQEGCRLPNGIESVMSGKKETLKC